MLDIFVTVAPFLVVYLLGILTVIAFRDLFSPESIARDEELVRMRARTHPSNPDYADIINRHIHPQN